MTFPVQIDPVTRFEAVEDDVNRVIFRFSVKADNPADFKQKVDKVETEQG